MTQTVEKDPEEKVVKGQLLDIIIETTLGAEYAFPDMDAQEAMKLLRSLPLTIDQLTLVNASGACLLIPARVIHAVHLFTNVKAAFAAPLHSWVRP